MSPIFVYMKGDSTVDKVKMTKLMNKILGVKNYEVEGKQSLFKLTIETGDKGLAMLQACFIASADDLESSFKALVVPMFSERFAKYVNAVPDRHLCFLFEVAHYHHEIYDDNQDLLKDVDVYTLLTVKAYIQSGNSPSLAALALYVHRNTVTYRIDRFLTQTGIDLRNYPNSVFVFFLVSKAIEILEEQHIDFGSYC